MQDTFKDGAEAVGALAMQLMSTQLVELKKLENQHLCATLTIVRDAIANLAAARSDNRYYVRAVEDAVTIINAAIDTVTAR
ncbi:MAG TPA: hypothetical protein VFB88_05645 [Xanthobacteraceae bacterium]|nr:hypothetical protein [Xanthobacteraceae bacterium]